MAKVLGSVTDTLVLHRIEELDKAAGMSAESFRLVRAAIQAALDMMRAAKVVPAVYVEPGPAELALAQVLAAYRDGTHQHIEAIFRQWPPLFAALEKLATAHNAQPIADPLYDILKGTDRAKD